MTDYKFSKKDFKKPIKAKEYRKLARHLKWGAEIKGDKVIITPMQGRKIVINGRDEAKMFCYFIRQCFR